MFVFITPEETLRIVLIHVSTILKQYLFNNIFYIHDEMCVYSEEICFQTA